MIRSNKLKIVLFVVLMLVPLSAGCSSLPFQGKGLKAAADVLSHRKDRKEQPTVTFEAETEACRCEMQASCN